MFFQQLITKGFCVCTTAPEAGDGARARSRVQSFCGVQENGTEFAQTAAIQTWAGRRSVQRPLQSRWLPAGISFDGGFL